MDEERDMLGEGEDVLCRMNKLHLQLLEILGMWFSDFVRFTALFDIQLLLISWDNFFRAAFLCFSHHIPDILAVNMTINFFWYLNLPVLSFKVGSNRIWTSLDNISLQVITIIFEIDLRPFVEMFMHLLWNVKNINNYSARIVIYMSYKGQI